MKQWLKERLGERWRGRIHRLSRLRWLTKYRVLRGEGARVRDHLGFLFVDPEVESYTYRLADTEALLRGIAEATGAPLAQLRGYAAEAESDPELGDRLARRLRWRFDVKHRPPLGNRLGWYVLVRALRPPLVVETGIYHGLGSLALLRALTRNRAGGAPGELVSVDLSDEAGWMVPAELRDGWQRVVGSTSDALAPALAGREVGALFQDTAHTEENQRFEFGLALDGAARELLLVDGSGGQAPTLERLSRERGALYRCLPLPAAGHWYQRGALAFAIFRRDA